MPADNIYFNLENGLFQRCEVSNNMFVELPESFLAKNEIKMIQNGNGMFQSYSVRPSPKWKIVKSDRNKKPFAKATLNQYMSNLMSEIIDK